jgi:anti-sigma factor RsiW
MTHVTLQQLSAYLDGELAATSAEPVRQHLSHCPECTGQFARIEGLEELLLPLLNHDPGDAFFDYFPGTIDYGDGGTSAPARWPHAAEPPRTAEQPPAAEPLPVANLEDDPERLISNEDSPRKTAPPAPLLPESPTLYGRREDDPPQQPSRTPAPRRGLVGWIAAAVLLVVAASVAVVTMRPRVAPLPIPSEAQPVEAPEMRSEEAPTPGPALEPELNDAPTGQPSTGGTATETEEDSSAEDPASISAPAPAPMRLRPIQPPPPPRPDQSDPEETISPSPDPEVVHGGGDEASTAMARTEVERAKRQSLEADRTKTVASYETAAGAWERVLSRLGSSPVEEAVARREWAQLRFQAWAAEPTPARRDAAIGATRAYLLYAPPGPDRDQAWVWLGRLKQ